MDGEILVTGASGFVGRAVVAELAVRGLTARAVEHRWRSIDDVDRVVGRAPLAACVHLGWYAHPADYLVAVEPNAQSLADTLALARYLDARGCPSLVVAGTSAEYARSETPHGEDDRLAPATVYGSAKAMCHALLRTTAAPAVTTVTWARLFNVIGPGEHRDRVVPMVVRSLLAGKPVDLSPGTQVRDYIDVRDVARALVDLAADRPGGAVNVGTGVGRTLRSVLERVAGHAGGAALLRFGARPFADNENMHVVARVDRLRSAVGWEPMYTLERTAVDVVRWWTACADA